MMNFVRFHTRGINRITCGFGIIVFGLLSFLETPPIFAQAIEDLSPEILSYGVVEDAKFTPDGKMIAVQIREGILFLDATTRASVKILPYPQTMRSNGISYNKILFSPDGERLLALVGLQPASGRSFMRLFIWNWKTGQLELVLRPVEEDILDVDFSGDGEKLYMIRNLFSGDNLALRVFDARTGDSLATYQTGTSVQRLITAPRTHLAWVTEIWDQPYGNIKGVIALYDMETGQRLRTLNGSHRNYISAMDISPDGSRLITSGMDGRRRLWDTESGAELWMYTSMRDSEQIVAFTKDGRYAIFEGNAKETTGNLSVALKVLDIQHNQIVQSHENLGGFQKITLSPANPAEGIGVNWHGLTYFNILTGETIPLEFNPFTTVYQTDRTGTDNTIYIQDGDGNHWLDLTTHQKTHEFEKPAHGRYAYFAHDKTPWMAYEVYKAGYTSVLMNWLTSEKLIFEPSFERPLAFFDVDDNFQYFVAANREQLRVWEISTRQSNSLQNVPDYITALTLSPDGKKLVYQTYEHLTLCDARTGEKFKQIPFQQNNPNLLFSPDGEWLVICADQLSFFSSQSLEYTFSMRADGNTYTTAEFTPDGAYLFAGTTRDQVELWDVQAGKRLWIFGENTSFGVEYKDSIRDLTWLPGSRRLIVTRMDGAAKVWTVPESLITGEQPLPTATPTATATWMDIATPTATWQEMPTATPTWVDPLTPTPSPTESGGLADPTPTPDPVGIEDWGMY